MMKVVRYCTVCGRRLVTEHFGCQVVKVTPKRRRCLGCIRDAGPDLVINVGNYHAELYTELMRDNDVKRVLMASSKYAKQLSREDKK